VKLQTTNNKLKRTNNGQKKTKELTCARRGQGRWGSGRRAGWRGPGRQAGGRGSILGWTCVYTQWKRLQSNHIPKANMYMYRYICRFLKECGALISVALSAEALGADGLLSVWDQRLASHLNAYNSRFVVSTTLSSNTLPPTESWEFSLSSMASHRILDVTFALPVGRTVVCRQAVWMQCGIHLQTNNTMSVRHTYIIHLTCTLQTQQIRVFSHENTNPRSIHEYCEHAHLRNFRNSIRTSPQSGSTRLWKSSKNRHFFWEQTWPWDRRHAGSRINFSTTFPDSYFYKLVQEWPYLQILLCFSSNPNNLVGKVFLCGRSWPQLQLRNEGTPPDFEPFFSEKRPWKRFSTNVLIRGEMNPLHKHKIMSVGYQVKQNLKSRSRTHF